MALKVIVFDFDGTIADTRDTLIEITNRLSGEFGYQSVTQAELEQLKNLSSREIVKKSKISIFKIPFLLKRVKAELSHKIANLKPISGITPYLFELKKQGYLLGIITSNIKENVIEFLSKNNLQDLFDFIDSETTLFGKHKAIQKFLRQNKLHEEEMIYVGDETRDIEAAKKSNVQVIAVTWGFNSALVLSKHKPNFLIHHPQELIEVITKPELIETVTAFKATNQYLLSAPIAKGNQSENWDNHIS